MTIITRELSKCNIIFYFLIKHTRLSISVCIVWISYTKSTIDRSPKVNCKINSPLQPDCSTKSYLIYWFVIITYINVMRACQYFPGWNSNIHTVALHSLFLFRKSSTDARVRRRIRWTRSTTVILRRHHHIAFGIRNRHYFSLLCKNMMTSCNTQ